MDIILSDINLGKDEPGGYEFLKHVRERNESIPFYFVSGHTKSDEEPKARAAGATGYLQVPVNEAELRAVLQ